MAGILATAVVVGVAGQGLQGTVDAVSSSSITVAGITVKVTSATQVVVDGAPGSLSDVTQGSPVFVHTEGAGSSRFAERVFVGSRGPPAPDGSHPPAPSPPARRPSEHRQGELRRALARRKPR
ncbi:MAG: DUF5666 domain-containing protein [Mycobacteriales bacterium]